MLENYSWILEVARLFAAAVIIALLAGCFSLFNRHKNANRLRNNKLISDKMVIETIGDKAKH